MNDQKHDGDPDLEELTEFPDAPEPDFENDIYPCPPGWDPSYWAKYGIGNQRSYWRAIKNSQKITGGP